MERCRNRSRCEWIEDRLLRIERLLNQNKQKEDQPTGLDSAKDTIYLQRPGLPIGLFSVFAFRFLDLQTTLISTRNRDVQIQDIVRDEKKERNNNEIKLFSYEGPVLCPRLTLFFAF